MKRNFYLVLVFAMFVTAAEAQIPQTISYQGFYTDEDGVPVNDGATQSHTLTFYFFKGDAADTSFSRTINNVKIAKGLFGVIIGRNLTISDGSKNKLLPADIWHDPYKIQVGVDVLPTGDKFPFTAVPYALTAANVPAANITGTNTLPPGVLPTTVPLGNGVVNNLTIWTGTGTVGNDTDLSWNTSTKTLSATNFNGSGSGLMFNGLGYTFPSAHGIGTRFLANNGSGTLTWSSTIPGSQIGTGIDALNISANTIDNARLDLEIADLADGTLGALNIGSSGQFAVNASGNITKLNNLPYSFPSSYAAAPTFLSNDGAGTLSWANTLAITNGGTGATSASAARAALGLVIGADVLAFDTDVADLADGILGALNVGSASQFAINASGNITKINNVPYFFPTTQGSSGSLLRNNGAGTLIWTNSNLNWDETNSRLGIGGTPSVPLHITGNSNSMRLQGTDHTFMEFYPDGAATRKGTLGFLTAADEFISLKNEIAGDAGATLNKGALMLTTSGGGVLAGDNANNSTRGDYSVALGSYAKMDASCDGCVFIGDRSFASQVALGGANSMFARFAGGFYFYTTGNSVGAFLSGSSWAMISDSTKKENFRPIDRHMFLEKIKKLKLGTWNYKAEDKTRRHYGPYAQEFYSFFGDDGIGKIGCDTTITTQDIAGINITAIQALALKADQLESALNDLKKTQEAILQRNREIEDLKKQVSAIYSLLESKGIVHTQETTLNKSKTPPSKTTKNENLLQKTSPLVP